jgi:hypothetical protein
MVEYTQFLHQISRGQACKLLLSLMRFARESVGHEVFEQAAKNLPENWAEFFLTA